MIEPKKSSLGRFIIYVMAATYFVALMFLAYLAIALLGIKCENFGCTGVGVGWVLWVAVFAIALGLGLFVAFSARTQSKLLRLTRILLVAQGISGLLLVGLYLVTRNTG